MKKKLLMLPCIAAVAIATFVEKKTFDSNACESNNILLANVEALADGNETPNLVKCGTNEVTENRCPAK